MVNGPLEVIEFRLLSVPEGFPRDRTRDPEDPRTPLRREQRKVTSAAVSPAIVALYALLVVPVIWGSGLPPAHPGNYSPGEATAVQWVMLTDSLPARVSLASSLAFLALSTIEITSALPTLLSVASLADPPTADNSDLVRFSLLAASNGVVLGVVLLSSIT